MWAPAWRALPELQSAPHRLLAARGGAHVVHEPINLRAAMRVQVRAGSRRRPGGGRAGNPSPSHRPRASPQCPQGPGHTWRPSGSAQRSCSRRTGRWVRLGVGHRRSASGQAPAHCGARMASAAARPPTSRGGGRRHAAQQQGDDHGTHGSGSAVVGSNFVGWLVVAISLCKPWCRRRTRMVGRKGAPRAARAVRSHCAVPPDCSSAQASSGRILCTVFVCARASGQHAAVKHRRR